MSDKTIVQKLLIKPGQRVLITNPPAGYDKHAGDIPAGVTIIHEPQAPVDVIQAFIRSRKELEAQLPVLKSIMAPKTILWIAYYKGTASVKTDINRDTINAYAMTMGLQGVAMIAVDDDWSALRLKLQ